MTWTQETTFDVTAQMANLAEAAKLLLDAAWRDGMVVSSEATAEAAEIIFALGRLRAQHFPPPVGTGADR